MQEKEEEVRTRGGGGGRGEEGKVFDLFQRYINSLSALVMNVFV